MEPTAEAPTMLGATATTWKEFGRRRFQAQTVKAMGYGGQRLTEQARGGNRTTLRKRYDLTSNSINPALPLGVSRGADQRLSA
jgi:hypothetical protein